MSTSTPTAVRHLPDASFRFAARGGAGAAWRVRSFSHREALSALYESVVTLACSDLHADPQGLLACPSTLIVTRGERERKVHGFVRRVEDLGATGADRVARVTLAPTVWCLSQRVNCAVFQELDVLAIVQAVLRRAGFDSDALRVEGTRRYRVREYCVQYCESDLPFIQRLLEDEGIGYRFDQGPEREVMVVFDSVALAVKVAEAKDDEVAVVTEGYATSTKETLRRFERDDRVVPSGVTLRDYDCLMPNGWPQMTASAPQPPGSFEVFEYPGGYALRDAVGTTTAAEGYARRLADVRRDERSVGRRSSHGESNLVALAPGFTLTPVGHVLGGLNQRHLVVRAEHVGVARDELPAGASPSDDQYHNRFDGIEAGASWVPSRATPRPRLDGTQTATVVGPDGESIHADVHGRIKVQFHWDRDGANDERSSCWIRVMQPWSGAQWGVQFIPRVGMEVVVSFVGGDPDRPLVIGSVYNGYHPTPFALPEDRSLSGIRTQSYGGEGHNELSFEDRAGAERVYVRAQRDYAQDVLHDRAVHVGHDEALSVGRNREAHVGGDEARATVGTLRESVGEDSLAQVGGHREESVGGDRTVRVTGTRFAASEDAHESVRRNRSVRVGGVARTEVHGTEFHEVREDLMVRALGNVAYAVGEHDEPRTFVVRTEGRTELQSSRRTEVSSDKELILRCGASRIRLTPERIEFSSPAGLTLRSGNSVVQVTPDKARIRSKGKVVLSGGAVTALTDGAEVKLTDEVKIKGSMVKLNPPDAGAEEDSEPKPPTPTKIELKDQDGKPVAGQQFIIALEDGTEIAGVLDKDGRAEVEVEGGGKADVLFVNASEVERV